MPTYDFFCEKCDLEFEFVESIKEYEPRKKCVQCDNEMKRIYKYCKFHHTGAKVEDAEFNPGLGRVTKSKAHRKELAKQMGVIEVGNDFEKPEKIHKHFDQERDAKLKKAWDEV